MAENNHDEIDLISLMIHIKRMIRKHRILILIILLFSASAAVAYRLMQPPVYENEMVMRSRALDETLVKVLAHKINKTNNLPHLKHCEMEQLNDKRKVEDLIHDNYFSITVHASDDAHWVGIQEGIITFLSHEPSVKNGADSLASREVVEVIDGFARQGSLLNKGMKYYVAIGLMMGLVLAFVIVALVELRKYLKNHEVRN